MEILKFAISTRIFVILIAILCSFVATDYDTSTSLLKYEKECENSRMFNLCRTFMHWDAGTQQYDL
jgi:hypothetical protein